jgi:hypothetical protein
MVISMGNGAEHGIQGAIDGLGMYVRIKNTKQAELTIQGVIGSLMLGGFAGILPDILEPPSEPNHRGFFHSKALLGILTDWSQKIQKSQNLTEEQKLVISIFSEAYRDHLALDSNTPKGIPFFWRW